MKWEEIKNTGNEIYYRRCSVPGGWLVEQSVYIEMYDSNGQYRGVNRRDCGIVFIPDPEHIWRIDE